MAISVTVNLSLRDEVTLRELRQFLDQTDAVGADVDVDIREHDDNGDLTGLAALAPIES